MKSLQRIIRMVRKGPANSGTPELKCGAVGFGKRDKGLHVYQKGPGLKLIFSDLNA